MRLESYAHWLTVYVPIYGNSLGNFSFSHTSPRLNTHADPSAGIALLRKHTGKTQSFFSFPRQSNLSRNASVVPAKFHRPRRWLLHLSVTRKRTQLALSPCGRHILTGHLLPQGSITIDSLCVNHGAFHLSSSIHASSKLV